MLHKIIVFIVLSLPFSVIARDTFDGTTGLLTIPAVKVGAETFHVTMQHQGNLVFNTTSANVIANAATTPDIYDSATGVVYLRSVTVGDVVYEVAMSHLGNLQFSVTNATIKTAIAKPVVVDCPSLSGSLHVNALNILAQYGYQKCAMVAGILIANSNTEVLGGKDITAMTQQQADILAEILDNDQDGLIDDAAVAAQLASKANNGAWMNMLSSSNESSNEQAIVEAMLPYVGKDMGVKYSWLLDTVNDSTTLHEKAVMAEEAIHMVHMLGYAKAYPAEFAVEDTNCTDGQAGSAGCNFTQSTVTRLAWEAMTVDPVWYRHPENSAVSNGIISGSCAQPSCAAIEFIMNVLVEYRGIYDSVSAVTMPSTQSAMIAKLDSSAVGMEMKAILDSPRFNQLLNGLTFSYNPTGN
ncbi:MAG: hypothetical protein H7A01_12465 [Hahellaceae bacterium]|nr:hypothetical protein [Hahellaceae bacterium]MCP5209869.1 hypothetical protein [Hahellaceae bacterium]